MKKLLCRRLSLLSFALLILASFGTAASAGDELFTQPSNMGGTGLWEIPSARVIRENSYRIGGGQADPYRYYHITVSPLRGLEITGRITEILDTPWNDAYGNHKDKAIDLKYQFISEGKYMPALSIGIMDPHGTRLYPSQYLVASKQIYPFDFTLGLGNGRFGKSPLPSSGDGIKFEMLSDPFDWASDSQFFWGIQFAPTEKLAFALEHSPIQYHKQTRDPAQPVHFPGPAESEYNFGMRYRLTDWSGIDLSYQRGDQIGVSFSMAFDIGEPLIPIYDRLYRKTPSDIPETPSERITRALHRSGFSDIGIEISGNTLWIEAQNDKYFYTTRAIGVIVELLSDRTPEDIGDIHIILKENGVPVVEFKTAKIDIIDLYSGKMSLNEFLLLSSYNIDAKRPPRLRGTHRKLFDYGLKPSFSSFLNDPSGFFKYRLGVKGWLNYQPWTGASFITGIATYPLNNISTSNEPLSIPIRSDIVLYDEKEVVLERVMYEQIAPLTSSLYGRLSAGLLETQFAGADMEIAAPVLDGRILLGISGSAVKKRSHENPLELSDNAAKDIFTTAFFNTRLNIPEEEMAFDIKAGRFLAGDEGVRFTISKYIKGVTIRAWYTSTDTSMFTDSYNKGYHDKGIGVTIPLRLFKGTDSKTVFDYALSPWTRDTGQDIDRFSTLFDFIGRKTKIFLDKDRKYMYK